MTQPTSAPEQQAQVDAAPQPEGAPAAPAPVHIAFIEVSNFRRLRSVRLDLDCKTTMFVGANNSGKTSAIAAIRFFLRDQTRFSAFDISAASWSKLAPICEAWDKLSPDLVPEPAAGEEDVRDDEWKQELETLQQAMPALDLWLRAEAGDFHRVSHLIPTLAWSGGLVGVRLSLQPASDIKELRRLALAYRQARSLVLDGDAGNESTKATTWPTDLLDYWKRHPGSLGRVVAYKLDPVQIVDVDGVGRAQPQPLAQLAVPFDTDPLKDLVRVDVIPAQRGLGTEEAEGRGDRDDHRPGLFSQQLIQFTKRFFDPGPLDAQRQRELLLTLAKSQTELDEALNNVLEEPLKKVQELGYPGLNDPQDMVLRSRIRPQELLNHSTAVQYRFADDTERSQHLPEHAIGLGYQNLLSLSFRLLSFQNSRAQPRVDPSTGLVPAPVPVHLVLLEEPEAHLHVQVQRTFVHKAYDLVKPSQDGLSSQLVLSTHSSHMAHALPFHHLRFFRRMAAEQASALPTSVVVGLGDVFGGDNETLRFVERYLQLQHSDLLFADAAIFIEGTAERMLVPNFVERERLALGERYLSYLEIGGSHAHRWHPLIERLGLTSLIITDLDPMTVTHTIGPDEEPIAKKEKAPVVRSLEQVTANPTLKSWLPQKSDIGELLALTPADKEGSLGAWPDAKVRVAYQIISDGATACATSFEDALLLENRAWFQQLPANTKGALGAMRKLAAQPSDDIVLACEAHKKLASSFDKGGFALDLLSTLPEVVPGAVDEQFKCPQYILEGLVWLDEQLSGRATGGTA